jgi:hypothetical protein
VCGGGASRKGNRGRRVTITYLPVEDEVSVRGAGGEHACELLNSDGAEAVLGGAASAGISEGSGMVVVRVSEARQAGSQHAQRTSRCDENAGHEGNFQDILDRDGPILDGCMTT